MNVCLEQNLLNQGRLPRLAFNGGRSGTVKVTQSCLTLCDPWTIPSPWNSPGQNTGVGSLSLLKGIFPTQGSNPGLLHCRWILYQLSHKGSSPLKIAFSFLTNYWVEKLEYVTVSPTLVKSMR